MFRPRMSAAALLLLSLFPVGAESQAGETGREAGWIGIQVEGRARADGSVRAMVVRVEDGSPAQRAGLRPFDVLLRLDGEEVTPEALPELGERLHPGHPHLLTVLRGRRERTLRVIAGHRPALMSPAAMEEFAIRVDSARRQILRVVDSLLADTAWARIRTEVEAAARILAESLEVAIEPETETDAEAMERTREAVMRARETMRSMRFGRPPVVPSSRHARTDAGESGTHGRSGPERTLDRERSTVEESGHGLRRGGEVPPPGVHLRSPYLLGGRFVAGAELEAVELDAPTGAGERRLRIVQVVEGSPADHAGLAPGDVIVRIDGEPAGTLREFRMRLGRGVHRGRPQMVIARGDTILVVTLPRP